MPDLGRIGGVTGWQRAAALAAARRIAMSSHLYPEIGARLLAATPTCHFLDYVERVDKIVQEPLRIESGFALVPERSGKGGRGIEKLSRAIAPEAVSGAWHGRGAP